MDNSLDAIGIGGDKQANKLHSYTVELVGCCVQQVKVLIVLVKFAQETV